MSKEKGRNWSHSNGRLADESVYGRIRGGMGWEPLPTPKGNGEVLRSQSFASMASFQEMPRISKQSREISWLIKIFVIFNFLRSRWTKAYLFCTKAALNRTETQGVMCHVDMC